MLKLVILTIILALITTIQTTYKCVFIWPSNEKKTGSEFYIITPSYITKEMQAYCGGAPRRLLHSTDFGGFS